MRWKSEDLLVVRFHVVDMQMVGPYSYNRSCFSEFFSMTNQ